MADRECVWVTLVIFQGIVDEAEVFRCPKDAENYLRDKAYIPLGTPTEEWLEDQNEMGGKFSGSTYRQYFVHEEMG